MNQPSDTQSSTAPPAGAAGAAGAVTVSPDGAPQPQPPAAPAERSFLQKPLDLIEKVGNMVPHPAVIFFILAGIVIVLSQLLYWLGVSVAYEVINPVTDQ